MIVDYIVELGLDVIKSELITANEQKAIKEWMKKFIAQQEGPNVNCTLEEEIDFEGLANYLRSDLLEDVQVLLFGSSTERIVAEKVVMSKAITYAQAKTKLSCDRAQKMTETAIDILRSFYRSQMSRELRFASAEVVDSVNDATERQLTRQTAKLAELIEKSIERCVNTFTNMQEQNAQNKENSGAYSRDGEETEIVFLIDENGKMVLDSPRYFVLLDWISRGCNDLFRVSIEDRSLDADKEILEKIQQKASQGYVLSESEEQQYTYIQEKIQRRNSQIVLQEKACALFLKDDTMRHYCNFESKTRILNFISRLLDFNNKSDLLRRNSSDFISLDFTLDTDRFYYFVVPIPVSALLDAGLGTNLGFMDVCFLSITSFDKHTIEEIMLYYYLDLAREILYRDASIENDNAALSLLSYRIGLH